MSAKHVDAVDITVQDLPGSTQVSPMQAEQKEKRIWTTPNTYLTKKKGRAVFVRTHKSPKGTEQPVTQPPPGHITSVVYPNVASLFDKVDKIERKLQEPPPSQATLLVSPGLDELAAKLDTIERRLDERPREDSNQTRHTKKKASEARTQALNQDNNRNSPDPSIGPENDEQDIPSKKINTENKAQDTKGSSPRIQTQNSEPQALNAANQTMFGPWGFQPNSSANGPFNVPGAMPPMPSNMRNPPPFPMSTGAMQPTPQPGGALGPFLLGRPQKRLPKVGANRMPMVYPGMPPFPAPMGYPMAPPMMGYNMPQMGFAGNMLTPTMQAAAQIPLVGTISQEPVVDMRHKCGKCGKVRSLKYQHDHPLKPGEVPVLAFCARCEKDLPTTDTEDNAADDKKLTEKKSVKTVEMIETETITQDKVRKAASERSSRGSRTSTTDDIAQKEEKKRDKGVYVSRTLVPVRSRDRASHSRSGERNKSNDSHNQRSRHRDRTVLTEVTEEELHSEREVVTRKTDTDAEDTEVERYSTKSNELECKISVKSRASSTSTASSTATQNHRAVSSSRKKHGHKNSRLFIVEDSDDESSSAVNVKALRVEEVSLEKLRTKAEPLASTGSSYSRSNTSERSNAGTGPSKQLRAETLEAREIGGRTRAGGGEPATDNAGQRGQRGQQGQRPRSDSMTAQSSGSGETDDGASLSESTLPDRREIIPKGSVRYVRAPKGYRRDARHHDSDIDSVDSMLADVAATMRAERSNMAPDDRDHKLRTKSSEYRSPYVLDGADEIVSSKSTSRTAVVGEPGGKITTSPARSHRHRSRRGQDSVDKATVVPMASSNSTAKRRGVSPLPTNDAPSPSPTVHRDTVLSHSTHRSTRERYEYPADNDSGVTEEVVREPDRHVTFGELDRDGDRLRRPGATRITSYIPYIVVASRDGDVQEDTEPEW